MNVIMRCCASHLFIFTLLQDHNSLSVHSFVFTWPGGRVGSDPTCLDDTWSYSTSSWIHTRHVIYLYFAIKFCSYCNFLLLLIYSVNTRPSACLSILGEGSLLCSVPVFLRCGVLLGSFQPGTSPWGKCDWWYWTKMDFTSCAGQWQLLYIHLESWNTTKYIVRNWPPDHLTSLSVGCHLWMPSTQIHITALVNMVRLGKYCGHYKKPILTFRRKWEANSRVPHVGLSRGFVAL